MTAQELAASALKDSQPPAGLSAEAKSLWFTKKGDWEAAHNIAQDIHTPLGSWIHALLHVIEGDQWNADYWFAKARKPSRGPKDVDTLWAEIADSLG